MVKAINLMSSLTLCCSIKIQSETKWIVLDLLLANIKLRSNSKMKYNEMRRYKWKQLNSKSIFSFIYR